MPFDASRNIELTSIGRQVLNSNRALAGFVLNKTQEIANKGAVYNRDILQAGLGALENSSEKVARLYDQLTHQGVSVEERVKTRLENNSDNSMIDADEQFERSDIFQLKSRIFDSIQTFAETSKQASMSMTSKLTSIPGKLISMQGSANKKGGEIVLTNSLVSSAGSETEPS